MIDIINGYGFKRNHDNTVFYSLSHFATVVGMQPYQIKEHYFNCVTDRAFSEGEFHIEQIENNGIEVFIPCKSTGYLIDSLVYEKILTEQSKIDDAMRLLEKHIETQNVVAECFDGHSYDYVDPLRKVNDHLPPLKDSLSKSDE